MPIVCLALCFNTGGLVGLCCSSCCRVGWLKLLVRVRICGFKIRRGCSTIRPIEVFTCRLVGVFLASSVNTRVLSVLVFFKRAAKRQKMCGAAPRCETSGVPCCCRYKTCMRHLGPLFYWFHILWVSSHKGPPSICLVGSTPLKMCVPQAHFEG